MFLLTRPSAATIERFLSDSCDAAPACGALDVVRNSAASGKCDQLLTAIGHGPQDFARARAAIRDWRQFAIGWAEIVPPSASIEVGTTVAVLIRHLGFWSLNGCRIVETIDERERFGFTYAALTNHAKAGEERFEVFVDAATGDAMYRIRAKSWPQAWLSVVGDPIARMLQARFRTDSAAAMRRAVARTGLPGAADSF